MVHFNELAPKQNEIEKGDCTMSDEITVHPVPWPPAPIKTERLVLRQSEARDRAALIDLFASPEVGTYVGGGQGARAPDRVTSSSARCPRYPGSASASS